MVEHAAVNRRVVGSNPTWGVFYWAFLVLVVPSIRGGRFVNLPNGRWGFQPLMKGIDFIPFLIIRGIFVEARREQRTEGGVHRST
jgi:hypothetical protein